MRRPVRALAPLALILAACGGGGGKKGTGPGPAVVFTDAGGRESIAFWDRNGIRAKRFDFYHGGTHRYINDLVDDGAGRLYALFDSGEAAQVDKTSLVEGQTYSFGDPTALAIAPDGTLVFVGDQKVWEVSPANGAILSQAGAPSLSAANNAEFGPDGKLYVLNMTVNDGPTANNGLFRFAKGANGYVQEARLFDGAPTGIFPNGGKFSSFVLRRVGGVKTDTAIVVNDDVLVAVGPTGTVLARSAKAPRAVRDVRWFENGILVVTTGAAYRYAFNGTAFTGPTPTRGLGIMGNSVAGEP